MDIRVRLSQVMQDHIRLIQEAPRRADLVQVDLFDSFLSHLRFPDLIDRIQINIPDHKILVPTGIDTQLHIPIWLDHRCQRVRPALAVTFCPIELLHRLFQR